MGKAFTTVLGLITTIGGLTYLFKFDIAKFLYDNIPYSYWLLGLLILVIFLTFCFAFLLISYHKLKEEKDAESSKLKQCIMKLDGKKDELNKKEKVIKEMREQPNKEKDIDYKDQFIVQEELQDNVVNDYEIHRLVNDLETIRKDLIKAFTYDYGNISKGSNKNSNFNAAKEYYLGISYRLDACIAEFIKKQNSNNIGLYPIRDIFNFVSLSKLADNYKSDGYAYSYDNQTSRDSINEHFNKINTLLKSFLAYICNKQ